MSITLFSYNNRYHKLVEFSINKSLGTNTFNKIVVASDRKIEISNTYTHIDIDERFNLKDYCNFCIKELNSHIDTDFVLVVQQDGFACKSIYWDDKFYDYDYIGAPFHIDQHNLNRPKSLLNFKNKNRFWVAGNGGFSLRSKKLLEVLQKDNKINLQGNSNQVDWVSEDVLICHYYRDYLKEKYKIRFAPLKYCLNFSMESLNTEGLSYGFHGYSNIPYLLTQAECLQYYRLMLEYDIRLYHDQFYLLNYYTKVRNCHEDYSEFLDLIEGQPCLVKA